MPLHFPRASALCLAVAAIACAALASPPAFAVPGGAMPAGPATAITGAPAQRGHLLPSKFHKGFVYLKTSVNGHPDAWMILDSGTTESIIDAAYAKSVGIKLTPSAVAQESFGTTKPDTFNTDTVRLRAGGEPEAVVYFESIGLGGMKGPDGAPAAGLLGRTFLDGKIIVIDYHREEVYFETAPQPADRRDIAMTLGTGIPIVKLTMAGQVVDALLDSGGTYGVIITPATAQRLGIEDLMAAATTAPTMGHGGEQHVVIGAAPPFSVGDLAVNDLKAAYTTFGTATDSIGAGVSLGIGFLKRYKVTLNYAANTVRFEP